MAPRVRLADASRTGHLALRRAERQQQLIELLVASGPIPLSAPEIARRLGVARRTVERDLERFRDAGVPFESRPGRGGGHTLAVSRRQHELTLDTAEVAAIISSMTIIGPTASLSATSAMRKLSGALGDG